MEPGPGNVLEAIVEAGGHGEHFGNSVEDFLHADDEEHVEAAEGVDGHEALGEDGSRGQSGGAGGDWRCGGHEGVVAG